MLVLSQSSLCSQWQSGWGTPQVGITSSLARSLSQMPFPQSDAGSQAGPPLLGQRSQASHRHSPPVSGLAAPYPWLSSQLFELCLSFPASPSPKKKTQEAAGENTHQVLLGGGAVFTEAGRREGSHGVGEIVGTRQTMGYRMTPAPTPTPGRAGEQLGPRKTG